MSAFGEGSEEGRRGAKEDEMHMLVQAGGVNVEGGPGRMSSFQKLIRLFEPSEGIKE